MAIVGAVEKPDEKKDSETETSDAVSNAEAPASKDFYAWSNLRHNAEVADTGHVIKVHVIEYGSKVTQKDLGVSDEVWNGLIELKVIRKSIPPKVGRYQSPKRKLIADAQKQMEIALAGGE